MVTIHFIVQVCNFATCLSSVLNPKATFSAYSIYPVKIKQVTIPKDLGLFLKMYLAVSANPACCSKILIKVTFSLVKGSQFKVYFMTYEALSLGTHSPLELL